MCRSVALFARFDSASALFVKMRRRTVGYKLKNGFRWHICGRKRLCATVPKHKGVAQDHIYINGNIKGRHNAAPALQRESTAWRDSGSQNPSLIHPRKTPRCSPVGRGRKKRAIVFCFCLQLHKQRPEQSILSAAVSFHSDWTNWDLLTANPIRAGTGQSRPAVCHPWHTQLPPPFIKAFVSVTSETSGFFFSQSQIKSLKTECDSFGSFGGNSVCESLLLLNSDYLKVSFGHVNICCCCCF